MIRELCSAIALLVIGHTAFAQSPEPKRKATSVLLGTVADSNLRPIVGADVNFAGSSVRISTDSGGRFRVVNVPAGKFLLIVRSLGFRPVTSPIEVANDDTLRLSFTLEPTAQELGTVLITERTLSAKLMDFDRRRRAGLGQFFTHEDIEKINPMGVVDIMRRAKGVRVSADGSTALSAREVIKPPCPMAIYVDGLPVGSPRLDFLPSPKEIAAIEVYAGSATLPVWLTNGPMGTRSGCGAILIWTNDGSTGVNG